MASFEDRVAAALPGALPPDLLGQSCRRVGVAATVFGGLWLVAVLVEVVLAPRTGLPEAYHDFWPLPGLYYAAASVALSLAMMVVSRTLSSRPHLLLDLGLVYLVANGLIIGLANFTRAPQLTGPSVSWMCVLILLYPAIAPNTPRKILVAGLIAASMDPLGFWVQQQRFGFDSLSGFEYIWLFLPNYLCAVAAVVPAHLISRLGREVTTARRMGSYKLEGLIGKGGMGEVYRASHRFLARPAAVKLVRPDVLSGSAKEAKVTLSRFRREAEVVASLRSQHTIDLYDFGMTDDGSLYLVMELLDGIDLETLVERFGPVPASRAVHFITQACDSLDEAHRRGMIHRDVKPSNLHTCRMGPEYDFIKVLDFGLVKAERLGGRDLTHLTSPELTTGTPAFMAPEMVAEHGTADPRADIYALGCVLYWLLTGHLLFDAVSPVAMMMKHLHDTPERPSARTEVPIPPELDEIVMACLAKSPDDRPADAAALRALLKKVPLTEWSAEEARAWWDQHLPAQPSEMVVRDEPAYS